jgi:excisionase family DNA binding protein
MDPSVGSVAMAVDGLGLPDSKDRLLEAWEVAAWLGVKEGWVRERTRRGEIRHVRLGRYVRYRRESIMAWIEETETHGLR